MKIREYENQCRIVGSEVFCVGRLFKILSMCFSIVGSCPKILGIRIRACGNQCRIAGSEVFWVGRLFKIWSMRFKIFVEL